MSSPITELPESFRPLLRSEYDRLIDLGVFEGMPIELVGGVLVEMSPQGYDHQNLIADLNMIITPQVVGRHRVSVQGPLAVDDISEPEPDLVVNPLPRYTGHKTGQALLVVEVAHSSLRFDLGEKARRYALAGYPEYWVIDVAAKTLHRHTGPAPDGTWSAIEPLTGGTIGLVAVDAVTVDLDELFAY